MRWSRPSKNGALLICLPVYGQWPSQSAHTVALQGMQEFFALFARCSKEPGKSEKFTGSLKMYFPRHHKRELEHLAMKWGSLRILWWVYKSANDNSCHLHLGLSERTHPCMLLFGGGYTATTTIFGCGCGCDCGGGGGGGGRKLWITGKNVERWRPPGTHGENNTLSYHQVRLQVTKCAYTLGSECLP